MSSLPFGKIPFIIILLVLVVGIGTVSAIGIITLDGDTTITGGLDVSGDITGTTISSLDSRVTLLEGGVCVPSTELCDGIDNDCDGIIDNGFANLGITCTDGLGACQVSGTIQCDAPQTGTECSVTAGAGVTELCDGIDNDCDGSIDNGFPFLGITCTDGLGACQVSGTIQCDAPQTGTECSVTAGAGVSELCDGIDNDCDGSIDNGFANLGNFCTSGQGTCQVSGTNICDAPQTGTECSVTAPVGVTELCDGLDNDCDGSIDNGFANLGDFCIVGLGICQSSGTNVCDASETGTECSATAGTPETEVCDGLDNDCDGSIDNGFQTAGVYDQDQYCGSCFVDCTVIFDKPNAYGTCDASATTACQMTCCTIGDGNAACDGTNDYLDVDGVVSNGCEVQVP